MRVKSSTAFTNKVWHRLNQSMMFNAGLPIAGAEHYIFRVAPKR
jgi:hypothetical protein